MAKEKEIKTVDYENDKVECNLCHRWMRLDIYNAHYGKCLDVEYLVNVAKEKGEEFTREDIEGCSQEIIDKLLAKYPPRKLESVEELWKK